MIAEIDADLAAPHPMHRLLQGDVGAGKTVVAVTALLAAVQGGHQGALMAPTEVLAEQHAAGVRQLLAGLEVPDPGDNLFGDRPLRVELLTNRVTGNERKRVLAGLADGDVDIVIGTHALIQEGVAFHSLGVVVVDEQHRFGVEQRAALRDKAGGAVPDVLVMTATPIPRTAAMTVYGDLDVSVLDELPPGRTPIVTRCGGGPLLRGGGVGGRARRGRRRPPGVRRVPADRGEREARGGVGRGDVRAAVARTSWPGCGSACCTGGCRRPRRRRRWTAFRAGELDVLVATTVIEVGVDVPNATVMVILDADRFGIAQLHQLRGRVGRGAARVALLAGDAPSGGRRRRRARGSRRWSRRPTASSWPRSTSTCAARARS